MTPYALILSRPALPTRTRYSPPTGFAADCTAGTGPAGAAQGGVAGAAVSRCPVLSSSQRHLGGCRRVRHSGSTTSVVNWPVAARWCHTAIWTDCTEAPSRRAAAAHESPSARSARTACTSVTFNRAAMTQARLQYIGPAAATSLRRRQLALPQAAHTTATRVAGRPRGRRATAGASCATRIWRTRSWVRPSRVPISRRVIPRRRAATIIASRLRRSSAAVSLRAWSA